MKIFPAVAAILLAFPALGQDHVDKRNRPQTECKGVIHGVVRGQDGKPWNGIDVILEPVGDYDYVLPRTKTDEHGEYRFEQVCRGRWGVFVRDEKAGYPHAGRYWNRFLYGGWSPQVKITDKNLDAQLNVNLPPKPGILFVHASNSNTKVELTGVEVELKVSRSRDATFPCADVRPYLCGSGLSLVPPDKDLRLHIKSRGFYEWKESTGRGKLIHLRAGDVMTIEVELDPIEN